MSKLGLCLNWFLRVPLWSNIRTFDAVVSWILLRWRSSWARCKLETKGFPTRPRTPPTEQYSRTYSTKRPDTGPERGSQTSVMKFAQFWNTLYRMTESLIRAGAARGWSPAAGTPACRGGGTELCGSRRWKVRLGRVRIGVQSASREQTFFLPVKYR